MMSVAELGARRVHTRIAVVFSPHAIGVCTRVQLLCYHHLKFAALCCQVLYAVLRAQVPSKQILGHPVRIRSAGTGKAEGKLNGNQCG